MAQRKPKRRWPDPDRVDRIIRENREADERRWLAEMDAAPQEWGWCYFVAGPDTPIKIGFSTQVNARLSWLRSRCYPGLKLLAKINGGQSREAYYHRMFAEHHEGNEWFERHPDIFAEIDRINALEAGAAPLSPFKQPHE